MIPQLILVDTTAIPLKRLVKKYYLKASEEVCFWHLKSNGNSLLPVLCAIWFSPDLSSLRVHTLCSFYFDTNSFLNVKPQCVLFFLSHRLKHSVANNNWHACHVFKPFSCNMTMIKYNFAFLLLYRNWNPFSCPTVSLHYNTYMCCLFCTFFYYYYYLFHCASCYNNLFTRVPSHKQGARSPKWRRESGNQTTQYTSQTNSDDAIINAKQNNNKKYKSLPLNNIYTRKR